MGDRNKKIKLGCQGAMWKTKVTEGKSYFNQPLQFWLGGLKNVMFN